MNCPFCDFIHGDAPKPRRYERLACGVMFEPLNPVTPGHMLFVPFMHVEDAITRPAITADVMHLAAEYARDEGAPCNLITSCGPEATQSVRHLHWHYVPRREGDGLALPWTGQKTT